MKRYKTDPELEKCLPPLDEEAYSGIKDSLKKNGYDKSSLIVVWEGRDIIVDGHHRYKACLELGIEPLVIEHPFESLDDAILYALEHQDNRRNQTTTQKALNGARRNLIQEKIAARKRQALAGENRHVEQLRAVLPEAKGRAREIVAKQTGVSPRTVEQVSAVLRKGVPELEEMMQNKKLTANAANVFVQHTPKEKQEEIVKTQGAKGVKEEVYKINQDLKAKEEAKREAEELAEFKEFDAKTTAKMEAAAQKISQRFNGATNACFLPNVSELWCEDCKWGFDVYLPTPGVVHCPFCQGSKLTKRDPDWVPEVIKK